MTESDQSIPVDPKDNSPEARHARQIAGLMPPFGKDRPGQYNGTKRCVSPVESLRRMIPGHDSPPYTRADLDRMVNGADPLRCMLAREVLCACSERERWAIDRKGKAYPAGTDPEPGKALERILDRLTGKPRQTVKIESEQARPAIEVRVEIAALIAADPSIRAMVAAAPVVDAAQPEARPAALEGSAQSAESSERGEISEAGTPKSASSPPGGAVISQATDLSPKCSDIIRDNDDRAAEEPKACEAIEGSGEKRPH